LSQQESLTTEKKEAELSKQTAVEKISELQAHRLVRLMCWSTIIKPRTHVKQAIWSFSFSRRFFKF